MEEAQMFGYRRFVALMIRRMVSRYGNWGTLILVHLWTLLQSYPVRGVPEGGSLRLLESSPDGFSGEAKLAELSTLYSHISVR